MTASEGKPLSQKQLDKIRPDHGDTLVIHQHSDSFNMGWLLVNGRYLSNQEVESLEAEVEQLQVKADKFDQIKSAMGWLADPSADIILMEISTYRQAAHNYKEKKDAVESALREAREENKQLKEQLKSTGNALINLHREHDNPWVVSAVDSLMERREKQKALGSESCTDSDVMEEKTK